MLVLLLAACDVERAAPETSSASPGAGRIGVKVLEALQEPCYRHDIYIVREAGRWYFKSGSVSGGRLGVIEFGEIAKSDALVRWAAEAEREFDLIATLQSREWITWEQFMSKECRGQWKTGTP